MWLVADRRRVLSASGSGWTASSSPCSFAVFCWQRPWYLLRRMAERHRAENRRPVGRRHGHAGQRGPRRTVAGAGPGDPGRASARSRSVPNSTRSWREYKMGKPLERTLTGGQAAAAERELRPVRRRAAGQPRERRAAERNRRADRPIGAGNAASGTQSCVSETAQARKSAVYMALAPVFILVVYYFVDPINTTTAVHRRCSGRCCWRWPSCSTWWPTFGLA